MKYPIGIQTFSKIIEGGYVYVDKTDLIYQLVTTGEYYFLSRPRRFGKSLLTTTLESYFKGEKELFKGLAIEALEENWFEYPVFHIDLSVGKYSEPSGLSNTLNLLLEEYEKIYGRNPLEVDFGSRFRGVVKRAYEESGKKVVILIDEYDKPLTDAIGLESVQEANRDILQGVCNVLKNADQCIRFAFLTGITRYGKLGVFSAANNLDDISMNKRYASICGITESELHERFDDEVLSFAKEKNISKEEMYSLLKKRYDGYHFSASSEDVYNPYSLLLALKNRDLENKWFSTGTPTYLTKIVKRGFFDLEKLKGDVVSTSEGLASFGNGEEDVVSALYQSGYLTIKDYDDGIYKLGFPNGEVTEGFLRYLSVEFSGKSINEWDADIYSLKKMIWTDDVPSFMNRIQRILSQVPFESTDVRLVEANFRNMLYLTLRATGVDVTLEHPVLGGRIDVCFSTNYCVYIVECKRDLTARMALEQIDEKRYGQKISLQNKKLVKIGVNFSSDERNIKEWAYAAQGE